MRNRLYKYVFTLLHPYALIKLFFCR